MDTVGIWTLVAIDWAADSKLDSRLASRLFEESEHIHEVCRCPVVGTTLLAYRSARGAITDALRVNASCEAKIAILSTETASIEMIGFSMIAWRLYALLKLLPVSAVVCAQSTYEIVRHVPDDSLLIFDLGPATLPEIGGRERAFQITLTEAPATPITIDRSERALNTIPGGFGYFAGRRPELDLCLLHLEHDRSVSITGVAGIGKTHFAVRVAREARNSYAAGVAFVSLVGVSTVDQVFAALARGLELAGEFSTAAVVSQIVIEEQLLVVLDGADACNTIIRELLDSRFRVAASRFLVTSIQPLGFAGEEVVPLPPMSVPPSDLELIPDDLYDFEATSLFMDRVGELHEKLEEWIDASAVAELTRRLGGHPQAICLAAGQTRFSSVDSILETADRLKGQVSYRRAIEASVKALPEDARKVAQALSTCATPVSAQQLARLEPKAMDTAALDNLRKAGLSHEALSKSGRVVYSLYPAIKSEVGRSSTAALRRLRLRHDEVFLELLKDAAQGHNLTATSGDLDLAEEHELDILTSLNSLADRKSPQALYEAVGAAWPYFYDRNHFADGYLSVLTRHSFGSTEDDGTYRASLFNIAGILATKSGQLTRAEMFFDTALQILGESGDVLTRAKIVSNQAILSRSAGKPELARDQGLFASELFRHFGRVEFVAWMLMTMVSIHVECSDPAEAEQALSESLRLAPPKTPFEHWTEAVSRAQVDWSQGRYAQAGRYAANAVQLAETVGDRLNVLRSLIWVAQVLADSDRARPSTHVLAITAHNLSEQQMLFPTNRKRMHDVEGHLINQLGPRQYRAEFIAGSSQSLHEVLASIC